MTTGVEEPSAPVGTLRSHIRRDVLTAQAAIDHGGDLLDREIVIRPLGERVHRAPPGQPPQHDTDHAPGEARDRKELERICLEVAESTLEVGSSAAHAPAPSAG